MKKISAAWRRWLRPFKMVLFVGWGKVLPIQFSQPFAISEMNTWCTFEKRDALRASVVSSLAFTSIGKHVLDVRHALEYAPQKPSQGKKMLRMSSTQIPASNVAPVGKCVRMRPLKSDDVGVKHGSHH
jgi:hypothetical protein